MFLAPDSPGRPLLGTTGLDQQAAVPLLVAGLIPVLWAVALVPLALGIMTRRLAALSAPLVLAALTALCLSRHAKNSI